MSLMLPFYYFLCGNNIYQVNNILESAPPTKHRSVIFLSLNDFPVGLFSALSSADHLSLFGGSGLTSETKTMDDDDRSMPSPTTTGIISYESSECLAISRCYHPTL